MAHVQCFYIWIMCIILYWRIMTPLSSENHLRIPHLSAKESSGVSCKKSNAWAAKQKGTQVTQMNFKKYFRRLDFHYRVWLSTRLAESCVALKINHSSLPIKIKFVLNINPKRGVGGELQKRQLMSWFVYQLMHLTITRLSCSCVAMIIMPPRGFHAQGWV